MTSRWLNAVSISTPQIRSAAMIAAASSPSMPGILMSRMARSGSQLADQLDRLVAAAGLADDLVALFLEGLAQVETDDGLVLGDHDTDRQIGVLSGGRDGGGARPFNQNGVTALSAATMSGWGQPLAVSLSSSSS